MKLSDIATGPQRGEYADPPRTMSLDDPALGALELDVPPQDGETFLLTVRCTARSCQVVSADGSDRWSGLFDLAPLTLVKQ